MEIPRSSRWRLLAGAGLMLTFLLVAAWYTGVAPAHMITSVGAGNVLGTVMTSSPDPISKAFRASRSAAVPLVMFTARRNLMGVLVNHKAKTIAAGVVATVIVCLNAFLLAQTFGLA